MLKFSIITPVYNCKCETQELLESLSNQSYINFEVIIVEDGSGDSLQVVELFKSLMDIQYFYIKDTKVSYRRNFGMSKAKGDYFIFFDSDCIIPNEYLMKLSNHLNYNYTDLYGAPDMAHFSFNNLQQSISYAMTSFLSTGGIRGGKTKITKFYPRSFNMGISRKVFEEMGGFPEKAHIPGEDMVFSIEIIKNGYKSQLISDCFVYHKRKATLKKFYKQIHRFAYIRLVISDIYPETFKIFYLFPTAFVFFIFCSLILSLVNLLFSLPLLLYIFAIFIHSFQKNRNINIAILSIVTIFTQMFAYGLGFLSSFYDKTFNKKEYNKLINSYKYK